MMNGIPGHVEHRGAATVAPRHELRRGAEAERPESTKRPETLITRISQGGGAGK
jgi:hypothetical protein